MSAATILSSAFSHRVPDETTVRALTRLAAVKEVAVSSTTHVSRDGSTSSHSITFDASAPGTAVLNRLAQMLPEPETGRGISVVPEPVYRLVDAIDGCAAVLLVEFELGMIEVAPGRVRVEIALPDAATAVVTSNAGGMNVQVVDACPGVRVFSAAVATPESAAVTAAASLVVAQAEAARAATVARGVSAAVEAAVERDNATTID